MNPPLDNLPAASSIAFKEWAAVCEALADGRQTIILRKGGIHEGREGFRVQHEAFWLYPTHFHEQHDHLSGDAGSLLRRAQQHQPPAGELHLRLFAVVEQVRHLASEDEVDAFRGQHVWSPATVQQRFHYRQPGLFALLVRMFRRSQPHIVPEDPAMAGCKSWVALAEPLSTADLTAVLTDAEFSERRQLLPF